MIGPGMALALALAADGRHAPDAGKLPTCENRVISRVVKRVGCTVGDTGCWYRSGGYCTDYVERRLAENRAAVRATLVPIASEGVRPGDVAAFVSRAHYAFVERVLRDGSGAAVAVDLAEFNFGGCWVDEGAMVTDRFGLTGRRSVALREVDGGFLRARPASR